MPSLEIHQIAVCAVAILLGFSVRGAAGFGAAAVATPLAALAAPAQFVIPVVALLQLVSTSEYGLRNWRAVAWRELARLAPVMTLGVAAGLYLFATIDPRSLSKGLGACVIGYACYVLLTTGRPVSEIAARLPWPIASALNCAGGLIGALFGGASSPFYAIYLNALRLPREAFRATMTMIVFVQVVLRIGGYAAAGVFSRPTLVLALLALPMMAAGGILGERLVRRVSERVFTRIVGTTLLVSGTALLVK